MHVSDKTVLLTAATVGLSLISTAAAAAFGPSHASSLTRRGILYKNGTAFSKTFENAVLYSGEFNFNTTAQITADISLTCTDCYVTGEVTTELLVIPPANGNLSFSSEAEQLANLTGIFLDEVLHVAETVTKDVSEALKNDTKALLSSPSFDTVEEFFHNVTHPDINVDFSLVENDAKAAEEAVLEDLPSYQFTLTLDAFEVFMQMQLAASGSVTYAVNLFTSESPLGIKVGKEMLGVVLTVDLLMNAEVGQESREGTATGSIELDSGFHLRINDGLALNIELFGSNVSNIVFNGGNFELLPVTVSTSALTLNAILRVGVHAGIELSTNSFEFAGFSLATYSAGAESVIFADVANLTLSVAAAGTDELATVGDGASDLGCAAGSSADLVFEEIFGIDIGANAGVSVQLDTFSWGVGPSTMLPIFYTTSAQCVGSGRPAAATATATPATTPAKAPARTPATTPAPTNVPRALSTTTVLSTAVVYAATACRQPGLLNCPVSLQSTVVTTITSTTTLTVPSGSQATWPDSTAVATTPLTRLAAFGDNAKSIDYTASGTPSSYVPPPPPSTARTSAKTTATGMSAGAENGGNGPHLSSKDKTIAIGVGVGVGVPVLVGITAALIFLVHRHRSHAYKPTPQEAETE